MLLIRRSSISLSVIETLGYNFFHFPASQRRSIVNVSSLFNLLKNPKHLQLIHSRFILHGLHQNPTLASKLIDSYASFGLLDLSLQVFKSISNPNPLLCNAIIINLVDFKEFKKTLRVYREMCLNSMHPDEDGYPFVLQSCVCLLDVETGKGVHGNVIKLGFDSFYSVCDALVEMYREYGELGSDHEVTEKMPVEAFRSGKAKKSFHFLADTRLNNMDTVSSTCINLLGFSVDMNCLRVGKIAHALIVVNELAEDLSVSTALLSMYLKLGSLEDARLLFEKMPEIDCAVWNIMILGHSRRGYPEKSIKILRLMVKSGVRPDIYTAIAAVSSVSHLKCVKLGKQIHAHVLRNNVDYQVSIHNALINMYCECNSLSYARNMFDLVKDKTLVSWSSMIKGYVTSNQSLEALSLFSKMRLDGSKADFALIIDILPACMNTGAFEQVKYFHGYALKLGLNLLSSVTTAFLISYAKCGCIDMARKLFDDDKVSDKDIITWNSMISAYSRHGDWCQCFELYNQMKEANLKPDCVTFLGLLTACVNSGLVKEGRAFFKEMKEFYGVEPLPEHYACMVDLLGRAGHIEEARALVKIMPFKPDAQVWGPLLSACKMHSSNCDVAESAAKKLISMEPGNAGNYVLLSNIYAAAGKWDGVAKMRSFLRDSGLKKTPGSSWLEIQGRVHEFRVADRSHPRANEIYGLLRNLEVEIKEVRDRKSRKLA